MKLKKINNTKRYQQYLYWIDEAFNNKVKANSPDGEKVQVALLLVKQYEDVNYPIPLQKLLTQIK